MGYRLPTEQAHFRIGCHKVVGRIGRIVGALRAWTVWCRPPIQNILARLPDPVCWNASHHATVFKAGDLARCVASTGQKGILNVGIWIAQVISRCREVTLTLEQRRHSVRSYRLRRRAWVVLLVPEEE